MFFNRLLRLGDRQPIEQDFNARARLAEIALAQTIVDEHMRRGVAQEAFMLDDPSAYTASHTADEVLGSALRMRADLLERVETPNMRGFLEAYGAHSERGLQIFMKHHQMDQDEYITTLLERAQQIADEEAEPLWQQ